ncbi:ABC transporter ATP-binding protein [Microbacterium sp. B2969]|uniref:ABC transporter ATP-binding protein n=1 Tax=Microbacterium alkaliflavum TaxID=3248839 RepID=A0ABW7Q2T6_9MICO
MSNTIEQAPPTQAKAAAGAALVVSGLRIKYGEVEAVKGIDFTINPGEFLTLLGPSGCGKTTTLRCIAGLEAPSGGTITLDGKPIASADKQLPPEKRGINMVFQSYAVWPHMTVEKNVGYGLKGLGRTDAAARVAEVLELVGLAPYAKRYGTELSGGQQQRVALARAIVTRPKLLLFDEPLSNLDAGLREQMRFELLELQRTVGITSVYVTHDQTEAMSMSDRVALMRDGVIEQLDSPREIYRRPASEFAANFIGRANLVRGEIAADRLAVTADGGVKVVAHEPYGGTGPRVTAVFRSERVVVGAEAQACENTWAATVERVAFLGRHIDVALRLPSGVIRAEVSADVQIAAGDQVSVGVRARDVHFVPAAGE